MKSVRVRIRKAAVCLFMAVLLTIPAGCASYEEEQKEDLAFFVDLMREESPYQQFYFEQLSFAEQVWYRDIYLILSGMEEERQLHKEEIAEIGEDGIDRIFQAVMNDHPELFYVEGYTCTKYMVGDKLQRLAFSGVYTMNTYERALTQTKLTKACEEALSGIEETAGDYEKIKYVYEYVILHTDYRKDALENQNICSVLLYGESVCQGYAKTVQYLLNKLNINATLVTGSVYGKDPHSFNLVEADGKYYYVDATWGDASYRVSEENTQVAVLPQISYDYLCVTDSMLKSTHAIDNSFQMPVCDSMDDNYFVREGAYFTEYDEDEVENFFEKAIDRGQREISLLCADENVYELFQNELLNNQKIFQFYYTAGSQIAYTEDRERHSMTFWLVNA